MSFASYTDAIAKPFMGITPWILRLSFATSFILHGIGKFPLPADGLVRLFESKGIFMPELTASLVALGEVGAGAFLVLGGFLGTTIGHTLTRLGGGMGLVIMTGAFSIAHADWFISQKLFMSEQIFLFALALYFAIRGNN
ncbi:MAG: DoxX family protein [Gammaproteobacteria bacterium]